MTCIECRNWSLRDSALRKSGMGPCKLGDAWQFWPAGHSCGKFAQAEKQIVDRRIKEFSA